MEAISAKRWIGPDWSSDGATLPSEEEMAPKGAKVEPSTVYSRGFSVNALITKNYAN
jgi:hypothetical protein